MFQPGHAHVSLSLSKSCNGSKKSNLLPFQTNAVSRVTSALPGKTEEEGRRETAMAIECAAIDQQPGESQRSKQTKWWSVWLQQLQVLQNARLLRLLLIEMACASCRPGRDCGCDQPVKLFFGGFGVSSVQIAHLKGIFLLAYQRSHPAAPKNMIQCLICP